MHENFGYYKYWGKAGKNEGDEEKYHLLPYHCLDVAAVGYMLLKNNVFIAHRLEKITGLKSDTICRWVILGLAYHEIGKFSESFQNLRPDLLKELKGIGKSSFSYSVRHDSLGYLLWEKELCDSNNLLKWFGVANDEANYKSWQRVIKTFGKAVTGHHGSPPKKIGSNNLPIKVPSYFTNTNIAETKQFCSDFAAVLDNANILPGKLSYMEKLKGSTKKTSWLIAGLSVFCDWVGSNDKWFAFESEPMELERYWTNCAVPAAEIALNKLGMKGPSFPNEKKCFADIFPEIHEPSPMQRYIGDYVLSEEPQLIIIEDVTGSGKTESALFVTRRLMSMELADGFFIALPTMATSNAMYERITGVYRKLFNEGFSPSLILSHSARHLSETFASSMVPLAKNSPVSEETILGEDSATVQCSAWLADNRKKALLADAGVGTIDQALLAILPSRFQSLRLFGIVRHVLIIDEVHAYDPYMNRLLRTLIYFQSALRGSVVLLSATLPMRIRQEMIDSFAKGRGDDDLPQVSSMHYPLATHYSLNQGVTEAPVEAIDFQRKKIKVEIVPGKDKLIRLIVETSKQGKCVGWISNTVHDALNCHKELNPLLDKSKLTLFHARFTMGDRLDIENAVKITFGKNSTEKERKGQVLIATQVVEQSLDLDFDVLITDLSPMDLLIQRAGRLHRHLRDERGNPLPSEEEDRRGPPQLYVYAPVPDDDADMNWYKKAFPKAAYVYPNHGALWLTARLLKERGIIRIPDDSRVLIETVFSEDPDRSIPEALSQRDFEAEAKWQAERSLAHINMLKLEDGYSATPNQWLEDMKAPTRLGGMESTVRLAKWDGKELAPWYEDSDFPWDMSQVNVRSNLVAEEPDYTGHIGMAVNSLKERLHDKGRWSILVVMEQGEDGKWKGLAKDKKGVQVVLVYDKVYGLVVLNSTE